MLTWQKRARVAALVVAVGVVAAVFATTRRREEPPPPAPVTRVDPAAVVESSGAFLVQVKGERETVTIRANKQLSYPDGSTRLLGVTVTSVRQGKTFVATGEEARVGENQTNLDMKGNVQHAVERRSRGDGRQRNVQPERRHRARTWSGHLQARANERQRCRLQLRREP